jgi:O-antigen/teichoic acid export membrane protein
MSLTRQIFKHTAIYSFASMLGRLISFIMLPLYANIFHAEGYGVMAMIDASLGVLVIMFASGLHVATVKIYHEEREERRPLVIGTAIRLVAAGALAAILIPMVFASQLSKVLLGGEQYSGLLMLSLVTFLVDVVGLSASTALIIEQRSILYSAVNLVRLVIGLTLNIWLVVTLEIGLVGVFIASLVAALVASGVILRVVIKEHGLGFDAHLAKKLVRFQLPLLPGDVIAFVSRQAEMYLIRFLIDIRSVGILDMAYKFPPLLNLFVTMPFFQAWRAKSVEIADQHHEASRIIGRMFTNYFFIMVFAGMVLAATIEDLLRIMTPPEFWSAAGIARIEIVTTILAGANAFFVLGLIYRKMTGTISMIKISMSIVKVPLAFLMIFSFQLAGAAYSALIVEGIATCVLLALSQRRYRIDYEYTKLVVIAVLGLVICTLITNDVLVQAFDLSSMRQATADLARGIVGLAPLAEHDSVRLLKLVLARQDSLISLFVDLCSSLMFLVAVPLLLVPRTVRTDQRPG